MTINAQAVLVLPGCRMSFTSGDVLNVINSLYLMGYQTSGGNISAFLSGASGSPLTLNYTGLAQNAFISGAQFAYVNSVCPLFSYIPMGITASTNILSMSQNDFANWISISEH